MKKAISIFCLFALIPLLGGCVSRTTTSAPQQRGSQPDQKKRGTDPNEKVLSKKIIWIWQDEFRNSK